MKYETDAACFYWVSCLNRNKISANQENRFMNELQSQMRNKFANHWYENNPLQGQGFRSMTCNIKVHIDSMLLDAAEAAGFDFYSVYNGKTCQMWIDPGEVEIETMPAKKRTKIYGEDMNHTILHDESTSSFYPTYDDQTVYYNSYNPGGFNSPDYSDSYHYDQSTYYDQGYSPQHIPFNQQQDYTLIAQ